MSYINDYAHRVISHLNELLQQSETVQTQGKESMKSNCVALGTLSIKVGGIVSSLITDVPNLQPTFNILFLPHAKDLTNKIPRVEEFAARNMFILGSTKMTVNPERITNYLAPKDVVNPEDLEEDKFHDSPTRYVLHDFFLLSLLLRFLVIVTLDERYIRNQKYPLNMELPMHHGKSQPLRPDSMIIRATSIEIITTLKLLCINHSDIQTDSDKFRLYLEEILNRVALLMMMPHTQDLKNYIDDARRVETEDKITAPSWEWFDDVMCCALSLIRERLDNSISTKATKMLVKARFKEEDLQFVQEVLMERGKKNNITGRREKVLTERLLAYTIPCDIYHRFYRKFDFPATNIDMLIAESFTSSQIKALKSKALGSDIGLLNIKELLQLYPRFGLPALFVYASILEDIFITAFRNNAADESGFFNEFFIRHQNELDKLIHESTFDPTPRIVLFYNQFFVLHENSLVDVGNDAILAIAIFLSYAKRNRWVVFKRSVQQIFTYNLVEFLERTITIET